MLHGKRECEMDDGAPVPTMTSTVEVPQEFKDLLSKLTRAEFLRVAREVNPEIYDSTRLGDFIREENPYHPIGVITLPEESFANAVRGGEFEVNNAANTHTGPIPKPMDPGSKTWYIHPKMKPSEIPDPPPSTPGARNVVKVIELEYGPDIQGDPGIFKAPHIQIVFCGGNGH
jgi:hypothetical protein